MPRPLGPSMKRTGSKPTQRSCLSSGVVGLCLLPLATLVSCSFGRHVSTQDDAPRPGASVTAASAPANSSTPAAGPTSPREHRVGVVRVIGDAQRFVLIELPVGDSGPLPDGTLLRCSSAPTSDAPTNAMLRVSTERRRPFIVADVLSGEPRVGDAVFLDRTAISAAGAKPTILPTATSAVLPIVIPGATAAPAHP